MWSRGTRSRPAPACSTTWRSGRTDLAGLVAKTGGERGIAYDLRRVPEGGPAAGVWQLFFHDPNGARVEIDLAASELPPQQT